MTGADVKGLEIGIMIFLIGGAQSCGLSIWKRSDKRIDCVYIQFLAARKEIKLFHSAADPISFCCRPNSLALSQIHNNQWTLWISNWHPQAPTVLC